MQRLNEAMQTLQVKIEGSEIKDVLKGMLEDIQKAICIIMPVMKDANILNILRVIKDLTCLALRHGSDEVEGLLKEIISSEEISSGSSISSNIHKEEALTDEQKNLISKLFEDLEMAYNHAARACGLLRMLSRSLSLQQLQILLKSSIKPLIQLNATPKFAQETMTR